MALAGESSVLEMEWLREGGGSREGVRMGEGGEQDVVPNELHKLPTICLDCLENCLITENCLIKIS